MSNEGHLPVCFGCAGRPKEPNQCSFCEWVSLCAAYIPKEEIKKFVKQLKVILEESVTI